jgi:glycosyltransferase involved in cell wall biosynthesis
MNSRTISVVITTRNEEKNISNVISACLVQTCAPMEIVVVDNHSTDDTCAIARSLGATVATCGPERSAQRNYGISQIASGDVIIYLDADMTPTATLFQACLNALNDDVVALHIDEMILGNSYLARIRRFERSFYSGTVIDGVRCFRREDFNRLGGFDESLPPGPEDWDLDLRFAAIGTVRLVGNSGGSLGPIAETVLGITNTPVPHGYVGILHNESRLSLREYLAKKSYYFNGLTAYVAKWGRSHPVVRAQMSPRNRLFGVFLRPGTLMRFLSKPHLAIGVLSIRLLVAWRFLGFLRTSHRQTEQS